MADLSPEELEKLSKHYESLKQQLAELDAPEPPSTTEKVLGGAAKGLDYLGGNVRNLLALGAEKLTGKKITKPEELAGAANVLSMQLAPSTSEYMDRLTRGRKTFGRSSWFR
jgi:hypothetical protein